MKANKKLIIIGLIALIAGLLIGIWLGSGDSSTEESHDHSMQDGKTQVWTCAMHPQIRQPEPGQCPICGMDLIPASSESSHADPMAVKMSESAMKLADVQTSVVGYSTDSKPVRLNGKVQINEQRMRSQASHVAGRIERLFVDFTGEFIQEGTPLATIYSPELVTAQKELIIAAKVKDEQPELYASAVTKLKNWKLSEEQIDELQNAEEADGLVSIQANTSGYVIQRKVQLGDYVKKGQSLYEVVDLSTVWLMFDVYESDLQWVTKGDRVTITLGSIPGKEWTGTVSYVDPVIDQKTRVAKARVELPNPGNQLKPEMFATGVIESQTGKAKEETMSIPKSAVMWTGTHSVVYVKSQDENGVYFKMRQVELGPELGDRYAIQSGIEAGEEIATNGTFSIDAAAQLAGKPSMMSPEGGPAPRGHDHGNHSTGTDNAGQPKEETNHEHDHTSVQDQSNKVPAAFAKLLDPYFKLKTALSKGDLENANQYAKAFDNQLHSIEMKSFSGASHAVWMSVNDSLKLASKKLLSNELDEIRGAFKPVSTYMIDLAEKFHGYERPVFIQFCPMADHNKGAHWLSQQENILNPYFGRSMLGCGSTKQTLL
ncbi:MAG: efflux RND transporter periplasmic adaptor subunit [Flavobacteriales bacterium]